MDIKYVGIDRQSTLLEYQTTEALLQKFNQVWWRGGKVEAKGDIVFTPAEASRASALLSQYKRLLSLNLPWINVNAQILVSTGPPEGIVESNQNGCVIL